MGELAILGRSGHVAVTWDPANADEVAQARAEFDRLRAAGYVMFTVTEVDSFDPATGALEARLAPVAVAQPKKGRKLKAVQTDTFVPEAPRTVAVPRMRGGC